MNWQIKLILAVFSVLFFLLYIWILKKNYINPFFSFIWFLLSIFLISLPVFEKFYKSVATLLGIPDASFLIIIGVLFLVIVLLLYFSVKISHLNDQVSELISFVGTLDKSVRDSKKQSS